MSGWPAELRVHWFGQSWGAPINEDCPEAPVPVGALCRRCQWPITPVDEGMMMPFVAHDPSRIEGEFVTFLPTTGGIPWVAHHYECQMEEVLGPGWKRFMREVGG